MRLLSRNSPLTFNSIGLAVILGPDSVVPKPTRAAASLSTSLGPNRARSFQVPIRHIDEHILLLSQFKKTKKKQKKTKKKNERKNGKQQEEANYALCYNVVGHSFFSRGPSQLKS